eukprot:13901115-Alexandrium_andersonii.AAC.1
MARDMLMNSWTRSSLDALPRHPEPPVLDCGRQRRCGDSCVHRSCASIRAVARRCSDSSGRLRCPPPPVGASPVACT